MSIPVLFFILSEEHFKVPFKTNVISPEANLPELTMILTTDEAEKRYCPMAISDRLHCQASACHGWRWLPGQRNVQTARGYCGMVPHAV
jgi:hypothetical protein